MAHFARCLFVLSLLCAGTDAVRGDETDHQPCTSCEGIPCLKHVLRVAMIGDEAQETPHVDRSAVVLASDHCVCSGGRDEECESCDDDLFEGLAEGENEPCDRESATSNAAAADELPCDQVSPYFFSDGPYVPLGPEFRLTREAIAQQATHCKKTPSEAAPACLPEYTIEPPDVLMIDTISLKADGSMPLEADDVVRVQVDGRFEREVIRRQLTVDKQGCLDLGLIHGCLHVAGLTADEAAAAIQIRLEDHLPAADVTLRLVKSHADRQVGGEHLVAPDGTINLGSFGQVHVAGMTLAEATKAAHEQLGKTFDEPKVALSVFAYNSRVYYIVTDGAAQGDSVIRLPITGNETVLDAIAQVNGVGDLSSKRIWIARPSADGRADQVLPVDFAAITKRACTETNYQILPGDRVFISSDPYMPALPLGSNDVPSAHAPEKFLPDVPCDAECDCDEGLIPQMFLNCATFAAATASQPTEMAAFLYQPVERRCGNLTHGYVVESTLFEEVFGFPAPGTTPKLKQIEMLFPTDAMHEHGDRLEQPADNEPSNLVATDQMNQLVEPNLTWSERLFGFSLRSTQSVQESHRRLKPADAISNEPDSHTVGSGIRNRHELAEDGLPSRSMRLCIQPVVVDQVKFNRVFARRADEESCVVLDAQEVDCVLAKVGADSVQRTTQPALVLEWDGKPTAVAFSDPRCEGGVKLSPSLKDNSDVVDIECLVNYPAWAGTVRATVIANQSGSMRKDQVMLVDALPLKECQKADEKCRPVQVVISDTPSARRTIKPVVAVEEIPNSAIETGTGHESSPKQVVFLISVESDSKPDKSAAEY